MTRIARAMLLAVLVFTLAVSTALAGGGQNMECHRGDMGQGAVNQVQVQDPPPFQP